MNSDLNDERLLLYYYADELSETEGRAIRDALASDAQLASRYRAICRNLENLPLKSDPVPPLDMVNRWHATIDRAADTRAARTKAPVIHSWSFFLGAAVTAALVAGISIGVMWSEGDLPPEPEEFVANSPPPSTNPDAFLRGLRVHLQESRLGLAGIPEATFDAHNMLITEIIQQNRLFERAAEQHNARDVARVLRAFELALVQLNTTGVTPQEAAIMRSKLMFELNVVLTKLSRDTSQVQETI